MRACDGMVHDVYELYVVNQSSRPVALSLIEVVDPSEEDAVLATYDGDPAAAANP